MQNVRLALQIANDPSKKDDEATQLLTVFKKDPNAFRVFEPQTELERFYFLQIVEEHIKTATVEDRLLMREKVMGMIASSKGFVLNKIATVVVLLFQQDYLTHWPTFFNELYQWSAHLDFFLLILENIHDQIVSQVFHRTNKEVQENTLIKDHMRLEAVPLLMNLLREFLMSHLTKPLIANRILKIIGCYVEWVDINLVVNPEFLPLLLTCFQDHQLMLNAAECMGEIVLKGMKAPEKIQLIQLLNLVPLLTPQDDPMLEEGLSRLVNHLGVELMRVYEDGTPEEKQASIQLVEPLLIHLLRYLSNEYDDTAMQTFGFLTIYLQNLKKNPKLVDGQFLMQLLQILIVKSKFDPEADPDQEDEFGEFRKSLKSYMESVAAIDMNLYTTCVSNLVLTTLDNKSLDWTDAELVLHLIFIYSEAMTTYQSIQPGEKIKGQSLFVQNQQPTALGLMLSKMFESGVSGYPHPSIPVLYFEILIRYHVFLQLDPKYFPEALQTFLDARGLHHPKRSIRMRLDYLFLRFTKLLRKEMVQFVDHIISGLVDILVIQDRVREKSLVPTKEHESSGQFHLFEALGFLITTETIPEDKQAGYLYFLQQPLLLMISNQLETQDLVQIWKLGDLVSSLGALYKAFPENCNQSLGQQGQQALSCIVTVLGKHRQYVHVRECTRNAIQRMTNGLGVHVLESIPLLLTNGLIGEDSELIEFMPFLGLLVHKFGPQIQQVMETLWHPLFVKIQTFLAQVPIGTDDLVNQDTLLKHFLQLLTTLFSYDLYRILVQPANIPDLEPLLQVILQSFERDIVIKKQALALLSRMVYVWGGDGTIHLDIYPQQQMKKKKESMTKQPLQGFDIFIYKNLLPNIFVLPLQFPLNDGNALLFLGELSSFYQHCLSSLGPGFYEFLNSHLNQLGLGQFVTGFAQALKGDKKEFRKWIQKFYQQIHP